MKQVYLNSYYHLFAEFILAYLLFQPVFGALHVEQENLYYVVAFLCSIVFVLIVSKSPSLIKVTSISLFLIGIVISILLSLNIVIVVLLLGFCFYRAKIVIINELEDYSHSILFYTFCAGLFVVCFNLLIKIDDVKDISFIVASVFILQLFYCIVIGYFKKLIIYNIQEDKAKFLLPLASIVTLLTTAVVSLYLLRDVFYKIFFGFIGIIFALLETILTPLLKLLDIEIEHEMEPREGFEVGFGEGEYEPTEETNMYLFWIIFGIIVIILISIAAYLIYRYLRGKKEVFDLKKEIPIYEQSVKNLMGGISIFSKTKMSEPENKIRKEVFQLEKFANKKGIERKRGETIRQWFKRLDIQMPDMFFDYYEQVRYGQQSVSVSEEKQFLTYSKKAKEQLKETIKERSKND